MRQEIVDRQERRERPGWRPARSDRTVGASSGGAGRSARERSPASMARRRRKHRAVAARPGAPIASRASAGELITDLRGLEALAGEWDALAVAASKPAAAPAWALAWSRHVAP